MDASRGHCCVDSNPGASGVPPATDVGADEVASDDNAPGTATAGALDGNAAAADDAALGAAVASPAWSLMSESTPMILKSSLVESVRLQTCLCALSYLHSESCHVSMPTVCPSILNFIFALSLQASSNNFNFLAARGPRRKITRQVEKGVDTLSLVGMWH